MWEYALSKGRVFERQNLPNTHTHHNRGTFTKYGGLQKTKSPKHTQHSKEPLLSMGAFQRQILPNINNIAEEP